MHLCGFLLKKVWRAAPGGRFARTAYGRKQFADLRVSSAFTPCAGRTSLLEAFAEAGRRSLSAAQFGFHRLVQASTRFDVIKGAVNSFVRQGNQYVGVSLGATPICMVTPVIARVLNSKRKTIFMRFASRFSEEKTRGNNLLSNSYLANYVTSPLT